MLTIICGKNPKKEQRADEDHPGYSQEGADVLKVHELRVGCVKEGILDHPQGEQGAHQPGGDGQDAGNGKTLTVAMKTSSSAQKLAIPGTPAPQRAAVMKKAEATGMILEKPRVHEYPGCGCVINIAHRREEEGRHNAVGEHLEHRAVDAVYGAGGQPQADDAHVGDRRIPDDVLQVSLGHGPD